MGLVELMIAAVREMEEKGVPDPVQPIAVYTTRQDRFNYLKDECGFDGKGGRPLAVLVK